MEKLQLPEVSVSRQVATVAMVSENNMAAPRWDLSQCGLGTQTFI